MSDMTVANTIIEQLGGSARLRMMIGAKDFFGDDNSVQFKFMKGVDGINAVKITLTGLDLYNIQFYKLSSRFEWKAVQRYDGVYNDQLAKIFRQVTGLSLSL